MFLLIAKQWALSKPCFPKAAAFLIIIGSLLFLFLMMDWNSVIEKFIFDSFTEHEDVFSFPTIFYSLF